MILRVLFGIVFTAVMATAEHRALILGVWQYKGKINPLPDGLVWIRGMDVTPVLTTSEELAKLEANRAKGD